MRLKPCLAVSAMLLALCSCARGPDTILDDGPRFPDAEGIATEVTLERIELDGKRSYPIGEDVESFTTRSHDATPLLTWKEKYVQLGLDDGTVAWIAGIGTVIKGKPPYTLYTGVLERVDDKTKRAVFEDGTTLAIGTGVATPQSGETVVTIDPAKHVITKIEAA